MDEYYKNAKRIYIIIAINDGNSHSIIQIERTSFNALPHRWWNLWNLTVSNDNTCIQQTVHRTWWFVIFFDTLKISRLPIAFPDFHWNFLWCVVEFVSKKKAKTYGTWIKTRPSHTSDRLQAVEIKSLFNNVTRPNTFILGNSAQWNGKRESEWDATKS